MSEGKVEVVENEEGKLLDLLLLDLWKIVTTYLVSGREIVQLVNDLKLDEKQKTVVYNYLLEKKSFKEDLIKLQTFSDDLDNHFNLLYDISKLYEVRNEDGDESVKRFFHMENYDLFLLIVRPYKPERFGLTLDMKTYNYIRDVFYAKGIKLIFGDKLASIFDRENFEMKYRLHKTFGGMIFRVYAIEAEYDQYLNRIVDFILKKSNETDEKELQSFACDFANYVNEQSQNKSSILMQQRMIMQNLVNNQHFKKMAEKFNCY